MKLIWCLMVVVTLFKDFAEGSCLSYGHSCWGAHGKRSDPSLSDNSNNNGHSRSANTQNSLPGTYANGSPSNRWALVKIMPDKRTRNVIYTPDDSPAEEVLASSDDYVGGGTADDNGNNRRRASLKWRLFKKLNGNREGAAAEEGPDEQMMIRRKLISDDQVLVNDSEDELLSEEDGPVVAPSYINVLKQI